MPVTAHLTRRRPGRQPAVRAWGVSVQAQGLLSSQIHGTKNISRTLAACPTSQATIFATMVGKTDPATSPGD